MTRLMRSQVFRLKGVLNMLYRPAEIAELMGLAVDTIYRSYIPAGAPCLTDEKGRMWIPGLAFLDWARQELRGRDEKRRKLEANQGYCLKCNRVTEMVDAHRSRTIDAQRKVGMIQGRCPVCRGKVNRFFKIGEADDQPAQL